MLSWSVPPGMTFPAALLISLEEDNMINQCVLIVRRGEGVREGGGREGGGLGCNLFSTPLEMSASFG